MSASLKIPLSVTAKTPKELSQKLAVLQSASHGRVTIIAIYFANGEHVCWYYPIGGTGEGVF